MSRTLRHRALSVFARSFNVVISLAVLMPFTSLAQSADEAALRQLVDRFFAAYQNRDLNALLPLWSEKSPNLAVAKQDFERTFAVNRLELKGLTFRKISVEDGKASVRVIVDIGGVDAKTGSAASGFGKVNRTLEWVREGEGWKVWRYVSSEQDLAAALASAQTDDERNALLARENELVTVDLVREVVTQGQRLQVQGNYSRALVIFGLAATVATTLGDQSGLGSALSGTGLILHSQGKFAAALEYLQKSLSTFQKAGDKAGEASVLRNAGNALLRLSRYKEAEAHFESSLKLCEELRDDAQTAATLNGLGNLHNMLGEYKQALEYFDQVRKVGERLGDKKLMAAAWANSGFVFQEQGDSRQAMTSLRKSLIISEELGDPRRVSLLLNGIGDVYKLDNNYTEALRYYEMSLKIREKLEDRAGIASSLNGIGVINKLLGNYTEALDYYQKSLKITNETGGKKESAATLHNIGVVHKLRGANADAMEYFQRSLRIMEEIGNNKGIALTLNEIGNVHASQQNYPQALEHYQKSLKIFTELGDLPVEALLLSNIGRLHYFTGNYSESLRNLTTSLGFREKVGSKAQIASTLNVIGVVYRSMGRYTESQTYCEKSLRISEEIGDRLGITSALKSLANLYLVKEDYGRALQLANRASDIARMIGSLEVFLETRSAAGEAYRALNRFDDAAHAFADAIAAVEELRSQVVGGEQQQERFFETQTTAYYEMLQLLIDQENLIDAFAYSERAKGRTLLDTLQGGRIKISGAMTSDEQRIERNLNGEVNSLNIQITREKVREQSDRAKLADLDARLQKARLDQERFEINLYAAHPELKVHRGQIQPISLDQAGKLIPDKETALLEYVVGKDRTQLFVLTKRPEARGEQSAATPILKVYTLNINEKDLTDRVQKFRGRLANQDFLFQEPARELYDLLLGPARAELQNKTNLIIVPDKILWELPFQALQPAPKRFLIENCAVSYTPSLTVLGEMIRARSTVAKDSLKLLALGNPAIGQQTTKKITSVLMDERLDPLPEAERQVKELAKLYGPSRSKIYIGPEAQEARVKTEAGGYGILHLAAHGILNDKNPMYSQVVLSQPEGDINEDGMLEAWEVMKLDLKADLVVLSACETARGKVGNGEGMIGLSWAFFVAGVPTTVASQWSVESASTTELMVEFHRNLERHKSKAESLRQAMLKLLKSKEYSRPFYWAGFVVVGNGR